MATGRPKQSLDLTAQERAELESIVASRSLPHGLVRRTRMILLTEDGVSVRETARRVKVTAPAVSNWRKRFREQRLSGLHDALKSGRPRTHDEECIAELLNTALARRPKAAAHWSVRTLAEDTGISKSTVQRYLSLFGVQPHRTKSFKLSTDPFFIEKVREVVGLYLESARHAWCCAWTRRARSRRSERTQPSCRWGWVTSEGITHDYYPPRHHHAVRGLGHRQRPSVHPVQATSSPSGVPELSAPHRRQRPQRPRAVHLIVDNYGTHKHARVKAWLARRPRFCLHYTPTYSSG